jgi:hypothetical protein
LTTTFLGTRTENVRYPLEQIKLPDRDKYFPEPIDTDTDTTTTTTKELEREWLFHHYVVAEAAERWHLLLWSREGTCSRCFGDDTCEAVLFGPTVRRNTG